MRKWLLIFLMAGMMVSGCLEAKLTANEIALCMRAASGELTHIPECTTTSACQISFRKTQPNGIGSVLGIAVPAEKSESEAIRGWMHANAAARQLEKLNKMCQTGNLGSILEQARIAGNELGNALARSEKSQVAAMEALQRALQEAESLELGLVRDTHAFEAYAHAVELMQELQVGPPKSGLAQKIQENKNYFAFATQTLTGKDSKAYAVDIASGFDLLKTPIKIIEPGNKGKLIIAFFPVWESFLNSIRTRKNIAAGLRAVEELHTQELVHHLEQGLAPTQGIQAGLLQHIREMEEGIRDLESERIGLIQEENHLAGELKSRVERMTQSMEYEREWRIRLDEWDDRTERKTWTAIEEEMNRIRSDSTEWTAQRQVVEATAAATPLSLGRHVLLLRARMKTLRSLEARLDGVLGAWREQEQQCVDLAKRIRSNSPKSTTIALAAKEVVEATSQHAARYCGNLVRALAEGQRVSALPVEGMLVENELTRCMEEVNRYLDALHIDNHISREQWLSQNHHSTALARSACNAARSNMKTAYWQSAPVQEWESLARETAMLRQMVEWLAAYVSVEEKEKMEKVAAALRAAGEPLGDIRTQQEWMEDNQRVRSIIMQAVPAIQEGWQSSATIARWKIVEPSEVTANQIGRVVAEWELRIPHRIENGYPTQVRIPLPHGLEVVESNGAWERDGDAVRVRFAVWPERIWVKASGKLQAVTTEEMSSWGEIIGDASSIRSEMKVTTLFPRVRAHIEWEAAQGLAVDQLHIRREGGAGAVDWDRHGFTLDLEKTVETIVVEGAIHDGIATALSLLRQLDTEENRILTYRFTLENKLGKKIRVDAVTGIHIDPIETIAASALDEVGNSLPWRITEGSGMMLDSVEIPARSERAITVVITQLQSEIAGEAHASALQAGLIRLMNSRFGGISTKARALLQQIDRASVDPALAQWAEGLPKWQAAYENLLREENMAWQRMDELIKRKNRIETSGSRGSKWDEQLAIATKGMENGNLDYASSALEWLENQLDQNDSGDVKNENPLYDFQQAKKQALDRIIALSEKLGIVTDALDRYTHEQSISCAKLLETDFICPLSENQLKDLKEEGNDLQKSNRAMEKMIEKNSSAIDWSAIDAALERNRAQAEQLSLRVEEARRALHESAKETQAQVGGIASAEKEWVENTQKMARAIENEEYGKAIYLGRNLLRYAAAQNSGLTGWAFIPEKTWPLAGVIIGVSGFGIYRWWKKKNQILAQPTPIPRGSGGITLPQSREKAYDGSNSPSRKMESPPASLTRIEP